MWPGEGNEGWNIRGGIAPTSSFSVIQGLNFKRLSSNKSRHECAAASGNPHSVAISVHLLRARNKCAVQQAENERKLTMKQTQQDWPLYAVSVRLLARASSPPYVRGWHHFILPSQQHEGGRGQVLSPQHDRLPAGWWGGMGMVIEKEEELPG